MTRDFDRSVPLIFLLCSFDPVNIFGSLGVFSFLAAAWDRSHLGGEKSICQRSTDNLPSPPTLSSLNWKESSPRVSGFGVDL